MHFSVSHFRYILLSEGNVQFCFTTLADNVNCTTPNLLVLQVRKKLVGPRPPTYSQYTCYTGIADFTPPDIDTVGYRVFLGNGRYFVSSDVGGGKMQWYGFHKEPEGESRTQC